jgi:hypothetical protein
MGEELQGPLAALGADVRATAISAGCKQTAAWCISQLPPLYAKFRQTNESRYGDEIAHMWQCLHKELMSGEKACRKAQELAASIPGRLELLHEQLGLPKLHLKLPRITPPRSRKAR